MIRKTILALVLVANLGFGTSFEDGANAYDKGDYKTALSIFVDLANKGDAKAQYNLGVLYNNGIGVKQDYLKAKAWYEKAVNQGNIYAYVNLGLLYAEGTGVKQNYKKAKELFGKACDAGVQMGCDNYRILNKQGY